MHPADMVVNEMSLADELAISTVDHDELLTLLAASFPLGEWLDTVVYRAQTGEIALAAKDTEIADLREELRTLRAHDASRRQPPEG